MQGGCYNNMNSINNKIRKKSVSRLLLCFLIAMFVVSFSAGAYAAEDQGVVEGGTDSTNVKAIAAAATIGVGAVAAAIAMGLAISRSAESIARQPEAEGSIRTSLLLGLVFIETAVIYTLVVAIMIIFVL